MSLDAAADTPGRAQAIHRLPAELAAAYRTLRATTDPVWTEAAAALGFAVARRSGAFVAYDGAGTIEVAPYDELDDDDLLAQIVLHELCHHVVQGPASRDAMDWGLDNMGDADDWREHAALRLQAAWLDRYGLRHILVPTTDFRAFYDALGDAPLDGDDDSAALARRAWAARAPALVSAIDAALAQTARAAAAVPSLHPS